MGKRERLSDETRDGLVLESALASNAKVTAAREAYYARKRAFAAETKDKTRAEMIAELKAHHPGYIVELLEKNSDFDLRERYVITFMPRREPSVRET